MCGTSEALEAVVQAKVEGNEIVRPYVVEAPERKAQPADLTEILQASVAALKSDRRLPDGSGKSDGPPERGARGKGNGSGERARTGTSAKSGTAKSSTGRKTGTHRKADPC